MTIKQMKWDITPFVCIGPVRLGMTDREVGALLDPIHPVIARDNEHDGSEREHRDIALPIVSYTNSHVSGVDTNRHVKNVFFKNLDIYQETPVSVLKFLERENGGALIALGMIIFENIGVSTTGFFLEEESRFFDLLKDGQDDRGLGVFFKGAFDPYMTVFMPISFVNR